MDSSDLYHWIAFNHLKGIGPQNKLNLLLKYKTPEAVFQLSRDEVMSLLPRYGEKVFASLTNLRDSQTVHEECNWIQNTGIRVIPVTTPAYPEALKEISACPPLICVWGEGDISKKADRLAVVGSRKMTPYGEKVTHDLVSDLVKAGIEIVSGFALGVDSQAHSICLREGGITFAVLGSGLKHISPAANRGMMKGLMKKGAFVSEFVADEKPIPAYFPRRNRMISGLSRGTLLIEALQKSGALITASYALEQNRDLFAVPGSILSPVSAGTNRLIQQGAKLVMSATDILEDWNYDHLQPSLNLKPVAKTETFSDEPTRLVYEICRENELTRDDIIEQTSLPAVQVFTSLTKLEMDQKIKLLPGGRYLSL